MAHDHSHQSATSVTSAASCKARLTGLLLKDVISRKSCDEQCYEHGGPCQASESHLGGGRPATPFDLLNVAVRNDARLCFIIEGDVERIVEDLAHTASYFCSIFQINRYFRTGSK